MKRRIVLALVAITLFAAVVITFMCYEANATSHISISFIGFTNNTTGLLGTSDKSLAVFSVTNRTSIPIRAKGFYFIQGDRFMLGYAPLGAVPPNTVYRVIVPNESATILTRIPTNGSRWRIIVPYSGTTFFSQAPDLVRRFLKDYIYKRRMMSLDFDQSKSAPKSDWVKP